MNKKYKLAVLVSHPTQFEAPLYKKIAESDFIDLNVFFWTTDRSAELVDPELGHPPGWDISLTEGYKYSLLPQHIRACWQFLRSEIFRNRTYDAVIVNGYSARVAQLTLLAGFFFDVPVILRSDTTLLYRKSLWKQLVKETVLRVLFPLIPAFMATGSLSKEYLLHYGVPSKKIFLWPYAVDNEVIAEKCREYMKQRDILRAEIGVPSDSVVVLAVNKFVHREGVFDLLKAYAQLAGIHPKLSLVLVGDGEQKELLIKYVREHHVPRVVFAGYQPYSLLPKYYALADVFVHPATNEPWGVSVNEAMACGLPVIVSNLVGAAYDLVKDGDNGFIYRGGDVESLRNTLEKFLLYNIDKRKSMRKSSLEIIKGWGYDKCLNEIEKVLLYLSETKKASGRSND
jgi:glycosyltransferase involved in cell wall biosynthesis